MADKASIYMISGDELEELYARYNRAEFIGLDPLSFIYHYNDKADREVVGLIASSLAYGRVAQIGASVAKVLAGWKSPARAIADLSGDDIEARFSLFKHRFTDGADLTKLLLGIKSVLKRFGSIEACFMRHYDLSHDNILPALQSLIDELGIENGRPSTLIPDLRKGGACKRLHMFLRWMVRKDDVDPGVWDGVMPAHLIVPLDTHMFKIARRFGFTRRSNADLKAAIEVTQSFGRYSPSDPVKFDFSVTRMGINFNYKQETHLFTEKEAEL